MTVDNVRLIEVASARPWALVIHGGAGGPATDGAAEDLAAYHSGLRVAFEAGEAVLADGGAAVDSVCAAVRVLEDDPIFNAGRGATLTAEGCAEHDASVMTGDGRAGAVAMSRDARHPIDLARAVMERTPHVLLGSPTPELVAQWGLETAAREWFVTPRRLRQVAELRGEAGPPHGTVGAVAVDRDGRIAAATSTGGMANKAVGRIGDSPIVGAGTFARDGYAGVSGTGHGEAFLLGAIAHDVYARMAYAGDSLAAAAAGTVACELAGRGAMGALIAAGADRSVVLARHSDTLLAAWRDGDRIVTHI